MNFRNTIKIILGAVATILLGAIGSGVWDRLLSPGLKILGNLVTTILSSISDKYSDSIYTRASSIITYSQVDKAAVLLMLILIVWLLIYAVNSQKENHIIEPFHTGISRSFQGWQGIISCGALLIFLIFMISTDSTINEIKKYSTTNMEIIRPYVGEKEYLTIRSNYLQMKNERDFKKFLDHLYRDASEASLDIDKFR
jgi:hypothetical protein